MGEVNSEPAITGDGPREPTRLGGLDLPRAAARLAAQVTVLRRRKHVKLLVPVVTVRVADKPDLLKHVEGPIHGRGRRLRVECSTPFDEFHAGHVPIRAHDDLDEETTLGRPPHAPMMKFRSRPRDCCENGRVVSVHGQGRMVHPSEERLRTEGVCTRTLRPRCDMMQ